jgi:hypothetical protein
MTMEDVERIVEDTFSEDRLQFLSWGALYGVAAALQTTGDGVNVPVDAHPNCESVCRLFSDGERWVPWTRYCKTSAAEIARESLQLTRRQEQRERRWQGNLGGRALGAVRLRRASLRAMSFAEMGWLLARRARFGRMVRGEGLGKLYHAGVALLELAARRRSADVRRRHTHMQDALSIVALPLEDSHAFETDRLDRCRKAHVYMDPRDNRITFVPACTWVLHIREALRSIAEYYSPHAAQGCDESREYSLARCAAGDPTGRAHNTDPDARSSDSPAGDGPSQAASAQDPS